MLKGTFVEMSTDASPSGWHTVPAESNGGKDTFYSTTRGNNVIAQGLLHQADWRAHVHS